MVSQNRRNLAVTGDSVLGRPWPKVALPVEIVEYILLLSIQQRGLLDGDSIPQISNPIGWASSTSVSSSTSSNKEKIINSRQALAICFLSKHYRIRFQPELYRHVTLSSVRSVNLFGRTCGVRPDLSLNVQSLAIVPNGAHSRVQQGSAVPVDSAATAREPRHAAVDESAADASLSACPNATHLLLFCRQFSDLSPGLYNLRRPKEVTLIDVNHAADLEGIVARHRDLTAAALQTDPRIRAILGSSSASGLEQANSSRQPASVRSTDPPIPAGAERSLTHLHLVNFDGRLLHHLVTVSSLTHLVLTHPLLPDTRPGVPGLSIIPRSHMMLLLGSGHIARIVIRAELPVCLRLMEELAPIEDRKLVFRPIRKPDDPLFPGGSQRQRIAARLGDQATAIYDAAATNSLDLLEEFCNRVRLSVRQFELVTSLEDPDTSRDSFGRTSQGRSSESSAGATSQSASTGSADDQNVAPIVQPDDAESDNSSDNEYDDSDAADSPRLSRPLLQQDASTSIPAQRAAGGGMPPLNIPIEELLRSERFGPAGPTGQSTRSHSESTPSQASSGASPFTTSSSSSSPARHQRQRIQRGPFVLRRTDMRGATQANIDLCAQLYEALATDAGLDEAMHFW